MIDVSYCFYSNLFVMCYKGHTVCKAEYGKFKVGGILLGIYPEWSSCLSLPGHLTDIGDVSSHASVVNLLSHKP